MPESSPLIARGLVGELVLQLTVAKNKLDQLLWLLPILGEPSPEMEKTCLTLCEVLTAAATPIAEAVYAIDRMKAQLAQAVAAAKPAAVEPPASPP